MPTVIAPTLGSFDYRHASFGSEKVPIQRDLDRLTHSEISMAAEMTQVS
jgi:hypothetical protein